jgi:hypothetical protein
MTEEPEQAQGNWLYIGPSIPPLGLLMNTIYQVPELPPALKLIATSRPAVQSLFVNVNDLAEAKRRIAIRGSLEHAATQDMLAIAKTTPR